MAANCIAMFHLSKVRRERHYRGFKPLNKILVMNNYDKGIDWKEKPLNTEVI